MFKKTLAVVAALFASTQACINSEFEDVLAGKTQMSHKIFMELWERFEKNEGLMSPNASHDKSKRMTQFAETIQAVIEHNKNPEKTYTKGLSKFSDMSEKEFMEYFKMDKTRMGARAEQHCNAQATGPLMKWEDVKIPDSWDWRDHNGVSPVKNQGSCGSCWTFSTVGALEAHELLKYKSFTPMSEQQLVDCASVTGNHGCEGGLPSWAFLYIQGATGISTETAYPYYAKDRPCEVDPSTFVLDVNGGSVNITEGDEVQLADALYNHGPVSVAFEVVGDFRDYKTGVYKSTVCKDTTEDVNHAVLAVGYGTADDGTPYWIVKNSWGTEWGDEGFFKIERGVNMCGIAVCNSYPNEVVRLGEKAQADTQFLQN